jgi:hypothetical protein
MRFEFLKWSPHVVPCCRTNPSLPSESIGIEITFPFLAFLLTVRMICMCHGNIARSKSATEIKAMT